MNLMTRARRPNRGLLALGLVLLAMALGQFAPVAQGATLPAGFQDTLALTGFTRPTDVRFAADGRVFVAEKSGIIKVFDNLADTTPTTFADLRTNVYDYWDRGLLSIALAPNFPTDPYVYALYTYDAPIGGTAPVWNDACPTPPGPTSDGCVASARLVRLQASGDVTTGSEDILINGWCEQYPSHSIGGLNFGSDGALYVSGGDSASFGFVDYGQGGNPVNPCGDPPGGPGTVLTPPTAEGGALRAQDLRTSGDPVALSGAVLRVDPATGAGRSDNPLASDADPNARRIIAYGLRNPFRFTIRPGTSEVWLGDVGWDDAEEINVVANPTDAAVENFGWPCYEGTARQPGYDAADLSICENLYGQPSAVTAPYYSYRHADQVVPGEACPVGSSSISGLSFHTGAASNYPSDYDAALFMADYSRRCIWVMRKGADGKPDPTKLASFESGASGPVGLRQGNGGDLFYVDFDGGNLRRITYQPVVAVATATPTSGSMPLPVTFGSGRSVDAGGGALTYAWDLDGDGNYNDSTAASPQYTYTTPGTHAVRLRVTNPGGVSATDAISVVVGNDLAHNQPATASSFEKAGNEASRANDGDSATRWSSAFIDNQWWQVDLGSTRSVGAISLNWEAAYAVSYQILTSTDGTNFTVAATENITGPGWRATTFATRTARYVRVLGLQRAVPAGISFYEAQVFGATTGNSAPVPTISAPTAATTWGVGDTIAFSGSASDADDGPLPASALSWTLIINHCPSTCHVHSVQTFSGVASGQFTAPDHEYPSTLELRLTATDSAGVQATTSVTLQPKTVTITLTSQPSGAQLVLNSTAGVTPFNRDVILGSVCSISAASPQTLNGTGYAWATWSDGGAQTHNIVANASATYTATFAGNQPPVAVATATPASGTAPLTVTFGSARSSDPEGEALTYAWDLDGDGNFNDSTAASPQFTYTTPGARTVRLRVTDTGGAATTDTISVVAGVDLALNQPATASSFEKTGDEASRANDGNSATRWSSGFIDDQWWQVDLGTARSVGAISLNWEAAYAVRYQILTSTDGTNFTVATTENITGPGWRATTFATRTARYVRVLGLQRAILAGISFWDARIYDTTGNQPPVAVATATPASGTAPLTVTFGSARSSDPEGEALTYAWDLDGDGNFNDSTAASPQFTYTTPGARTVRLRVTDTGGAATTDTISVVAGVDLALNQPATASSFEKTGDEASRANDGNSATRWSSGFIDDQWWQVDLGTARSVGAISLNWEAAYAVRYQILTSTDGTNFTVATTENITGPGWRATTFATRTARYVRVLGLQRAILAGISFWDARIYDTTGNQPPVAVATATPASGTAPLTVTFGSARSSDPEGEALTYAWDLDGDGNFNDSTAASPQFTYTTPGARTVRLRVTDTGGAATTDTISVVAGVDLALNQPATASSFEKTGDEASRANDGNSATRWSSGFIDDQWWQVDLGTARSVGAISLNWEAAYAVRYQILTSTDGTNFTVATTENITGPGWRATTFATRTARYVRVLGLQRAILAGISFWDARIYDTTGSDA